MASKINVYDYALIFFAFKVAILSLIEYNYVMDFSAIRDIESKQGIKTANRQNVCFVSGKGNILYDTLNHSYLDFSCGRGETCLGYSHAQLSDAIVNQAQNLLSVSDEYLSEPYVEVISKLLLNTSFNKCGLMGSASDAILASLSILSSYLKEKGDDRNRIVIASNHTYHQKNSSSTQNSFGLKRVYVDFNNFDSLKKALTPSTAAFIIEPIVSDGSVKSATYDYLVNAYALCKSMDILLFCDETRIGIGRTGTKFAFEHFGIQPDLIILSRGLGGGLPIGAVLAKDCITDSFKPTERSLGRGSNLLSCVAANIVLDRLDGDALSDITQKGEYLLSKLCKLNKHNFVVDIRGRGLLAGIELSPRIMAAKIVSQMEKEGYLLSYTDSNVVRLSPSFIVTKTEIDLVVDALTKLFSDTNI